jgi:hypothetical protein
VIAPASADRIRARSAEPDPRPESRVFSTSFRPCRGIAARCGAATEPVPIRTLLETPGFALSGPAWGARLRFGLLAVDEGSMDLIAGAMGVAGAP